MNLKVYLLALDKFLEDVGPYVEELMEKTGWNHSWAIAQAQSDYEHYWQACVREATIELGENE